MGQAPLPGHTRPSSMERTECSGAMAEFQTTNFLSHKLYFPCFWGVCSSKLFFSSRLCHSFLYSYKAFWEELWEHCSWSGGACPRSCKILLSLHCLQKPPLCLPLAFEVWEPESVCKGEQTREQAAGRLGGLWGDAMTWSNGSSFCSSPFQARNIAVCIEFRDSDEADSRPLKVGTCYF